MAACTQRSCFPAVGLPASSLGAFPTEKFRFPFAQVEGGNCNEVLYVHAESYKNHFNLSAHSPSKPVFQEGIQWCSRSDPWLDGGTMSTGAGTLLAVAATECSSLFFLAPISAGEAEAWAL